MNFLGVTIVNNKLNSTHTPHVILAIDQVIFPHVNKIIEPLTKHEEQA